MRQLFCILTAIVLLAACSGVTPEWKAASEAQKYYSCLAEDNATGFLEGKAGIDSLPDDYCEQLLEAVKQYQADVKTKHGGLSNVRIADSHYQDGGEVLCDTALGLTYAFLILCYGDSTQEEITVPMVAVDGRWLMK